MLQAVTKLTNDTRILHAVRTCCIALADQMNTSLLCKTPNRTLHFTEAWRTQPQRHICLLSSSNSQFTPPDSTRLDRGSVWTESAPIRNNRGNLAVGPASSMNSLISRCLCVIKLICISMISAADYFWSSLNSRPMSRILWKFNFTLVPLLLISQGTLPWQPILGKIGKLAFILQAGVPNITVPIHKC